MKMFPNSVNLKIISITSPQISAISFSSQRECWHIALQRTADFLVNSTHFTVHCFRVIWVRQSVRDNELISCESTEL
jgi:hypothetical protein